LATGTWAFFGLTATFFADTFGAGGSGAFSGLTATYFADTFGAGDYFLVAVGSTFGGSLFCVYGLAVTCLASDVAGFSGTTVTTGSSTLGMSCRAVSLIPSAALLLLSS
jgi:hypothetical protein